MAKRRPASARRDRHAEHWRRRALTAEADADALFVAVQDREAQINRHLRQIKQLTAELDEISEALRRRPRRAVAATWTRPDPGLIERVRDGLLALDGEVAPHG